MAYVSPRGFSLDLQPHSGYSKDFETVVTEIMSFENSVNGTTRLLVYQ